MGVPNDSGGPPPLPAAPSRREYLRMTLHTRFALLALVLCAVLVAGARHASAAPATQARSDVVGTKAASVARHLLGARYSYGGTTPSTGFDCSGFVRFVY